MKIVPCEVAYVDHMGTDLSAVNAARVSFSKVSKELDEKDIKLIHYLANHNHWTPFGHAAVSLRIKAPIFVARQLAKHQVGLVWNEVSRRYVDDEPEFYWPEEGWRQRAENKKQGSDENKPTLSEENFSACLACEVCTPAAVLYLCFDLYKNMIQNGVAPEQARMILPQNTMTEWIWTGSLYAWARVANLRLDPHAQKETRDVVQLISNEVEKLFPISWDALVHTEVEYL